MNKKNDFTNLTEKQLANINGGVKLFSSYFSGIPDLLKGIVSGLKSYHKHPIKGFK
ncbi:bacteriocin [Muribaculaceae bacterium Isolate-100 (HZI)]|nr:bacteriocin [Muribaculaceae bacterium Isolate-100 (HZI)]